MLTLPAGRLLNVAQNILLRESVAEKEMHDATKKAKAMIDRLAEGLPMDQQQFGMTYGSFDAPLDELPVADEEEEDVAVADPMTRRDLGPLQPETLPSDDEINPFPGLERPLG